jgi:hypothetical protein
LALAVGGAALAYELWALYVAPIQPRGFEAAWLAIVMQPLTLGLFQLLLLLFPDGRPRSPRWRPVVWATLTVCAVWTLTAAVAPSIDGTPNPIFWLPGAPGEVAGILAVELWRPHLLLMGLGALSVLARYRRARGRQRQQVKWLAYVAVPMLASFALLFRWAAIGIAILRDRLYDIDRLIDRTLVYGLLSVLLALVSAGGVFILGPLLNPAGGESALAIAASASTSIWTRSPPSCWRWLTRPCSRPTPRCGCGRRPTSSVL